MLGYFAIGLFAILAARMLYLLEVRTAAQERALERILDELEQQVKEGSEYPIEQIDYVLGVEPRPRLFHIGHHREDGICDNWLLTVAPDQVPSEVLVAYPQLTSPEEEVVFLAEEVDSITFEMRADGWPGIKFPFDALWLRFSEPSATESFALRIGTATRYIAGEVSSSLQAESTETPDEALARVTRSLPHTLGIDVQVHAQVRAAD